MDDIIFEKDYRETESAEYDNGAMRCLTAQLIVVC